MKSNTIQHQYRTGILALNIRVGMWTVKHTIQLSDKQHSYQVDECISI